jgi:[ribosomal protein S5]-alanine N-acetyltransferase
MDLPITTGRLLLRRVNLGDASNLAKVLNCNDVIRWFNASDAPWPFDETSSKSVAKFLRGYGKNKRYHFALDLDKDNRFIGQASLREVDVYSGTAEVGYWLGKDYWGNGFATEALGGIARFGFLELGLRRIDAEIWRGNYASKRVAEKLGFEYEGTKRRAAKNRFGEVFDVDIFGLLKEKFLD